MKFAKLSFAFLVLLLCSLAFSCGGSGSSGGQPSRNTQAIVVNGGPNGNYANGVFTTVTVCAPGSSKCQTISGVLVDTGSFGLRLLSSALGPFASALPQQRSASGNSVFECAQFVDSVIWGPVETADIQVGGEKASGLPIEVIDSTTVPVPAGCKSIGPSEEDLSSLGANGILGIGFFQQDCGNACAITGASNAGFYYGCAGSSCQITAQPLTQQVQNPVGAFGRDNNGVVVQLPATSGAATVSGSLVFGIGTDNGNQLGAAQIFLPDSSGNLQTSFKGQSYPGFIDSGSNGYFFLNSATTGLANCPSAESGFYCPSSPANLTATNTAGTSSNAVNFTIDNASQLFAANSAAAFPTLGGPNSGVFDWGLPFFFGRKVFVAIEGRQTPAGAGPFWAY